MICKLKPLSTTSLTFLSFLSKLSPDIENMAALTVGGALLSSVFNVVLDRMSSPEVANWIRGKRLNQKLLERLKTTLYAVQAFLNDAEKRQIKEIAVKDWLDILKDAVYKADDLLDEVSTMAATQKDHATGNFLSRYLNFQDREMASRMEDIIDTLETIVKQKGVLGLKEIPKECMSWRITTSLVESSDMFGRDKDKEAIIKLLLDDTSDGDISAIAIVGMGGIGKTTLAQLVYHDDQVKQSFDFQAWVCVSEEFDAVMVTKTILQAVTRGSIGMNDLNLLQHDLKERLSRQKFLVVLDDVWNETYDDWIRLLKPFRNGIKGSKILITTRSTKVASVVQTVPSHELGLLSDEDCWLVFAKHALLSIHSIVNPTLEKIGRQIVNKCRGLPLAAQTLGGLLRGKHDVGYWNHILKSEIWEFSEDRSKIIPALRISYHYLPSCLKECFVYCSLYPRDYQFDKDELILLWMAENFLQPIGRKSLEEVGYEYFDELVSRSFFQHLKGNLFVMHDLMHDLATFYAGEFYFRAEEDLVDTSEISSKTRHLSHNGKSNFPMRELLAVCDRFKHTRTFLEINLDPCTPFNMKNAPCVFLSQLKFLRVLSLKYFPLDSLPDSIGELIHLRYLDLSKTCIVKLPESISNLYNLQTLKLSGCDKLKTLPMGMQNLVNLRHLDIKYTSLEKMPKGMNKLKHLQFLSNYVVAKNEENMISELGALTNLRGSLCIDKVENVIDGSEAVAAGMVDKKNINILELSWSSSSDSADSQNERDVLDKLHSHTDLKELTIQGYKGTLFPNWLGHPSFHRISALKLRGCRNCCMLPSLGQLPSLKYLWISGFEGLEIIGPEFYKNDESNWVAPFPSLETLRFVNMSSWQKWYLPVESDAFPQLKRVEIYDCPVLKGDFPNLLPALGQISIGRCDQLACSLPVSPVIRSLWIEGDNKLTLGKLPCSLQFIWVEGNNLVESLLQPNILPQLNCLRTLLISNFSSAISFPVSCSSLRTLGIRHCRKLEFQMEHRHESLHSLDIHNSCDPHTSFSLDAFPNLTTLSISECENMESLVVLQSSSSLRSLTIEECPSFVSFSTLMMNAPQLERLRIKACPEIDSFHEGGLPPNLRDLHISHCEKLVSCIASMNSNGKCQRVKLFPKEGFLPTSLDSLLLSDMPSLEVFDCKGLSHLASLEELTIENCPMLKSMVGERLPASLIRLFIRRSALFGKRCETKDPIIWPKISNISSIQVDGRWVW